ncbi:MAG: hypothetical protein P9L99_18955 [Candidatus Lernaella stagnicola]|nr:hypothetical protein [Candidatus Lernaella stagnicola]
MREFVFLALRVLGIAAIGVVASFVVLNVVLWLRFLLGSLRDRASWRRIERVTESDEFDIGEAQQMSIQVLFEWHTSSDRLIGDAGMSYLIEVDGKRFLFDVGDRRWRERPSPLCHNLQALGYDPEKFVGTLDAVVLSHNHREHVGGTWAAWTGRSGVELDFSDVPVYSVSRNAKTPHKLAPGVAVSPRLPGRLYVFGRVYERMLIVNLAGKGLVCIVADAHPEVLPILAYALHLTGQKTYAYIGGLHALLDDEVRLPWRWLVSRRQPWLRNRPEEIGLLAVALQEVGVKKLYVSAHDSDKFSLGMIRSTYGDKVRILAAGDKYTVD